MYFNYALANPARHLGQHHGMMLITKAPNLTFGKDDNSLYILTDLHIYLISSLG